MSALVTVLFTGTMAASKMPFAVSMSSSHINHHLRAGRARLPILKHEPSPALYGSFNLYQNKGNTDENKDTYVNYLDWNILDDETTAEQSMRFLTDLQEEPYFSPLDCNLPACNTNTTWTSGGYDPERGTVVIPCGFCVVMNYQEPTLVLPFGIDIQGRLYFPDGYSITIVTPFVLVQGQLEIESTGTVKAEPLVDFVIRGSRESVSFPPAHNNKRVCPNRNGDPGHCSIGFRSVTVAGGKINARGLPSSCTTWTHLQDVVDVDTTYDPMYLKYTTLPKFDEDHPNPYCRTRDPYIFDDFNAGAGYWTAGYGGPFHVVDGVFRATNRKTAEDHGPIIDMVHFQECLIPGQVYLFSAKIRLWDPFDAPGAFTPCARDGRTECLALLFDTRSTDGRRLGGTMEKETPDHQFKNYEWQHFYSTIVFDEEDLDPANIYHLFQLRGPNPRYNIDIDHVTFSLPHHKLLPDPENVCGYNLVANGDAEGSDIHPYPLISFGGHLDVVEFGGAGNHAFRLTRRSSDKDVIAYRLDAPNCIKTGSRYQISARVFANTIEMAVPIVIKYRVFYFNGDSSDLYTSAECPPSRMQWTRCESRFAIVDDIDPASVKEVRFWFETIGAPTVDYFVDDFAIELGKGAKSGILVSADGIEGCWDEGAEILITSHTTEAKDSQVRRLVRSPVPVDNGMVRLELDEYIVFPVTAQHDEGLFAVEVALLSRNIRFRAERDFSDPLLGGHFMVLRTPHVDQHIEGIEFLNFGQQGELGRYPIHLHLCKNTYSVISKNSIRGSNQRCVVIHGSHNATIVENIAFDTFGHCFMNEDGGELDNKFIRNLGSNTKVASRVVREGETDDSQPSTFWMANPQNELVGNVAAGSEAHGYWFELLEFVKEPTAFMEFSFGMNPKRLPMSRFLDNVAHSNFRHGLKMYPHGLLPEVTAVFENFKSYKNRLDGIFFRNVDNSVVRGGVLADNRNQVDFDRSDTILMEGTRLIGSSERFKDIIEFQGTRNRHSERIVGIELHTHVRDAGQKGLTVRNISLEGFAHTGSAHTALVEIDWQSDDVHSGNFNYWSTFEGVTVVNNTVPHHFDFTKAILAGYHGAYVVDLDSSLKPLGSTATGTSTAIADTEEMRSFVDTSRCIAVPDRGYLYCRNTCFRSITFGVDPGQIDGLRLRIRAVPAGTSYLFEGKQDYNISHRDPNRHEAAMADFEVLRYFTAALPAGDFRAMFINVFTGERMWPTFVETLYEPAVCDDPFRKGDIELDIPSVDDSECQELIRNGDMELATTSAPFWLHHETGLALAPRRGRDGSNALTDTDQDSAFGALGQYLDVRCLNRGEIYLIKAWIYLERDGDAFVCDYEDSGCPKIRIQMKTQEDDFGVEYSEHETIVASEFARPFKLNSWNLLHGIVTVDERLASATRAVVFVERRTQGTKLLIDDVSMTRLEKNCNELVFNGDFSQNTSIFWDRQQGELDLVPGVKNNALLHSNRQNGLSAITQRIQTGCLKEGERYIARARVKLRSESGSARCNPNRVFGDDACPRLRLRAFYNYGHGRNNGEESYSHPQGYIASADHGMTPDGWMGLTDVFTATNFDELADQSVLYIDGPRANFSVIVDEVSIVPLPKDCSQLILNRLGGGVQTVEFWRLTTSNNKTDIKLVETADNKFFRITNREFAGDGMMQRIDDRCMSLGSKWKVGARIMLRSKLDDSPVSCVPKARGIGEGACPAVCVSAEKNGNLLEDSRYFMTNDDVKWDPDAFNKYETYFEITNVLSGGKNFLFGFRNFDSNWDLLIDGISVTPAV